MAREEPDMGASAWRVLLMRLAREGMRDEAVVALQQMHLVGVPFDEVSRPVLHVSGSSGAFPDHSVSGTKDAFKRSRDP